MLELELLDHFGLLSGSGMRIALQCVDQNFRFHPLYLPELSYSQLPCLENFSRGNIVMCGLMKLSHLKVTCWLPSGTVNG